jgi:hypothetical protein
MEATRPGAGGTVVPADRVKVAADAVPIGAPRRAEARGEPKVQLVREDGTIRAIDVLCPCGEWIRIRCDYG